ncbi:MAG: ABC transporter ATP-binding protein/permease [Lachnospiraceae bacterium]|nr:ABC transporter ATP-binding protein/permease [Lachnospiraceae bacterium]MDE6981469.1 ABC transporter ATP-binding protein/permease [Lachnospiraceae bacterium]
MKNLLIYLKDYKKECVLAPLFKMLEAIFELFVPLVMASVIDVGIAEGDTSYIIKMCLILILLGIVGLISAVTAQYFSAKAAAGFGTAVRHGLFAHIQRLSFTNQDKLGDATLITRMTSDVNQAQSGVNMVLRLFLRSPFIVFGAMVMAFTIDVTAALTFVVIIPLLSLVVFGVMAVSIPLYKKVQGKLDSVTQSARENLTGVRVIRAFHLEQQELEAFGEKNQELTRMQMFVGKISGLLNPVTYVMINAATAYLIYQGALRVDSGILTQGEVVALVNYMGQILVELIKLANLIVTVTKAIACGNRIQTIFEVPEGEQGKLQRREEENGEEGMVVFSHVGLTYQDASEESLTDISFCARRGETIGVIGGTGSGKTSLVHLIPGFYPYTKGSIRIAGKELSSYEPGELRKKVGIVMQKAVLFKGTIRENLSWGRENATDQEMREALETAQALEIVEKKEGLDTVVSQGGKNFSGGQRQRLTIARALVRKPEILILDDSASALDYATDAALRKAIAGLQEKPTVFIVSQRASSIQYADKILVLEDGELAGAGTHSELLDTCQVYQEIYYSQFPENQQKGGKDNG